MLTHECNNDHPVIGFYFSQQLDSGVQAGSNEAGRQDREDDANGHALGTPRGEIGVTIIPLEDPIAQLEEIHLVSEPTSKRHTHTQKYSGLKNGRSEV